MTTKGDTISRIRNSVKAINQDAFVTDRYIYALVLKHAKLFIKRMDDSMKLGKYRSLFETIPGFELEEVSTIQACCAEIKTCCTVRRTKERLPQSFEGAMGPILRTVSSIDGSQLLIPTYPAIYARMSNSTNFKYNKNLYYWVEDGYLISPSVEWEAINVEGLWVDSIEMYKCDGDPCLTKQEEPTAIPEFLFSDIEKFVVADLLQQAQIPQEPAQSDNISKYKN